MDGRGQRGRDEEGADGTVFFAAKWQRARANRVGTSAATSQEESTREPPTSLLAKAKGPSSGRHRQAVGRGSPGPSFLFRIFPCPLPPPPFPVLFVSSIATSVSFISPPTRRACYKIFNFGRWHVPGRRISSSSLLTPLLLRRFFVEPRLMKLLACDKLVNWKRSSPISSMRNDTFHDQCRTKRSFFFLEF